MPSWIMHVDMDAFFASVEQAMNPALAGRPVVVGGDGEQRTVVASCSYEARARGVRNAMRTEEARRLCPEAVFLPGEQRLYRDAAAAVFERVGQIAERWRPVSLDEAYVALDRGEAQPPLRIAEELCRRIRAELRLPLSVGVGTSPLVARLATDLAKPRGCFLVREGHERAFVQRLPVERLPGVGRRTKEMLHRFNVASVRELAGVSKEVMVRTFGQRGALLHDFAHARDERAVTAPRRPRSIGRESSLERPTLDAGLVLGLASWLCERGMKEALEQDCHVGRIELRLEHVDGIAATKGRTLPQAVGHEANLIPHLQRLVGELFVRRCALRRVGVTLSGLRPRPDHEQLPLFAEEEVAASRQDRLNRTLRLIRERHGFGAVLRGPAIDLLGHLPIDREGFRLRIPSLTR